MQQDYTGDTKSQDPQYLNLFFAPGVTFTGLCKRRNLTTLCPTELQPK